MNEMTTDEIISDANSLPANIGGVKWYLKDEADKEIARLKQAVCEAKKLIRAVSNCLDKDLSGAAHDWLSRHGGEDEGR